MDDATNTPVPVRVQPMCRNCQHYAIEAARDASGRVRRGRVASCLWVSIEPTPISVTTSYSFHIQSGRNGRKMGPNEGADCPCFTPPPERTA